MIGDGRTLPAEDSALSGVTFGGTGQTSNLGCPSAAKLGSGNSNPLVLF